MTAGLGGLDTVGAVRMCGAAAPVLQALVSRFENESQRPGTRIEAARGLPGCEPDGCISLLASRFIGPNARPVRALLFDKRPGANWAIGWHQDRVIAVEERLPVEGYTNWTRKDGTVHVQPPIDLLQRMITLRVHLDHVPIGSGELEIVPGSHLRGFISDTDAVTMAAGSPTLPCEADAGDIWVYRSLTLHRSAKSVRPDRRRVLHLDFSADELPAPLRWATSTQTPAHIPLCLPPVRRR